jgi:glycosyltransferase involved in cell wall biosynthesis
MRCPTLEELPPPPPGMAGWPWTEECPQLPATMPDGAVWPVLSVVTPSYNQGEFIEQTIRSVLLQGFPNLEYVIMDGGSSDNSVAVIQKYSPWLSYWVSQPDRGQSAAINTGFKHTTGALLGWLNSDDYYMPAAFEVFAQSALAHPKAEVFVGNGRRVTREGRVVDHRVPPPKITLDSLYHWMNGSDFCQPSCMFRRKAWDIAGQLDESIHLALDVDLWMRMAKAGCQFLTLPNLLTTTLLHKNAKTEAYLELSHVDCAIIAIRHGGEYAVRGHLEELARRVAWSEPNLLKILNHPVIRFFLPVLRFLMKPAVRQSDIAPRWTQEETHISQNERKT